MSVCIKKSAFLSPSVVHILFDKGQSRTTWRKLSSANEQRWQILECVIPLCCSKVRVGVELWEASHSRNLMFSGALSFQIQLQAPSDTSPVPSFISQLYPDLEV